MLITYIDLIRPKLGAEDVLSILHLVQVSEWHLRWEKQGLDDASQFRLGLVDGVPL